MKKKPGLLFCIAMDLVGMLSFLMPGLGEWFDIIWAPLSAIIFFAAYGGKKGVIGGIISFTEEALPFLDFVPTFTIAWIYSRFYEKPESEVKTTS